jgi:pyruvate dehydrogenase E2 component (dihydrolipoamide acetyltransferase)
VKADIEAALAGGAAKAAPKPAAAPAAAAAAAAPPPSAPVAIPPGDYEEMPLTGMRKTIARRLTEAKRDIPHIYLTIDVELDALLDLRKQLNAKLSEGKMSVNDMIIKACALALKKVPKANAIWGGDKILISKNYDVSVAVALDEGLITPIVRNADRKGFSEIGAEMRALASRARAGKLKLEEFQGGAFSLSNLGMFGVKDFCAVINPPQAMILAVGMAEQRPVVKQGALAIATMMTVTLSCDHRIVDGALGAEWLKVFKGLIEDPLTMML